MENAVLIAELEKTAAALEALATAPVGAESATDYLSGLVEAIGG